MLRGNSYKLYFNSGRLSCVLSLSRSSERLLFVVFEFHDERLDVLSLALPLLDALLSIRVEVLLLLVK